MKKASLLAEEKRNFLLAELEKSPKKFVELKCPAEIRSL